MQYPGKIHNGLLKLTMHPIEKATLTTCYPLEIQFTFLWHYRCFFGRIQLELVGFHTEYHTRTLSSLNVFSSEKRSNFLLAYD